MLRRTSLQATGEKRGAAGVRGTGSAKGGMSPEPEACQIPATRSPNLR